MQKPADWHEYDPEMTISKLVIQECLHEVDGSFPITLSCEWLGGDVLLEILRSDEQLFAIYYFSEYSTEIWAANLGFKFTDSGWKVIESLRGKYPYIVGMVVPRCTPGVLAAAVEQSFELLQPDLVKTGNYAIDDYVCPAK